MSQREKEIYEFGPFRLDVAEHTFVRNDGIKYRHLPEKAFQTLSLLVRNSGHLVSKHDLIKQIWPDSFVEENNLDKCIHTIRNALGEKPGEQKFIETVRKHGYRFVAAVHRVGNSSPSVVVTDGGGLNSGKLAIQGSSAVGGRKFQNAFEAYQQARILNYNVMAAVTSEALGLVSESIRLDPQFAPAYSLMAEIIFVEVIVGAKLPKEGFCEARAAIDKAYELGADSADFYSASAYVHLIADWNFEAAERDLTINPYHGTANRMLAETFMFQCRHDEAAVHVNRAQVDELTATRNADILAISRFFARDYQAVIDVYDQLLRLYPRFIVAAWTRCWALEQLGRADEAITGYEKILRLPYGEPALRWIGYAYAVAGDKKKALAIASRLEAGHFEQSISPCHLAALYSALNDPDKAFSHLERSLEMGDPWMLWTAADPRFDNLRSDPRFTDLIRRVGLK